MGIILISIEFVVFLGVVLIIFIDSVFIILVTKDTGKFELTFVFVVIGNIFAAKVAFTLGVSEDFKDVVKKGNPLGSDCVINGSTLVTMGLKPLLCVTVTQLIDLDVFVFICEVVGKLALVIVFIIIGGILVIRVCFNMGDSKDFIEVGGNV
uniref:Na_Ca_ex domain-containing protein n=1 Tax=Strongyloides papillosus TaxID=174720 RepID=A0A0N5C651_STREA